MVKYEMSISVVVEADSEENARRALEDRLFNEYDEIHDSLAWDCE